MDRLLNVIKKLLLTINWIFCLVFSVSLFITANTADFPSNQNGLSPFVNEWWYDYLTLFSQNPTSSMIVWIGIGFLVFGFIVHLLISWIFE